MDTTIEAGITGGTIQAPGSAGGAGSLVSAHGLLHR